MHDSSAEGNIKLVTRHRRMGPHGANMLRIPFSQMVVLGNGMSKV